MRRWSGHMNGEQYLANVNTKEVHDLDNEKTVCQIDEYIATNFLGHGTVNPKANESDD